MVPVTQLSGGEHPHVGHGRCVYIGWKVTGRCEFLCFPGNASDIMWYIWTLWVKPSQILLNHSQKCTRSQTLAQTYSIELFRGNHQNSAMLNRHQTFLATVTRISSDHRISASALTKTPCWKGRLFGDTEDNDTIFYPCQNPFVLGAEWYYISLIKNRENMAWLDEATGYVRHSIICLKVLRVLITLPRYILHICTHSILLSETFCISITSHKFSEETELTFL